MTDFVKVAKEYKKMCDSYRDCSKCPIRQVIDSAYTCRYWTLIENPEKAEEVIMKWAKESEK